VRRSTALLALCLAVLGAGCGGNSQTYSIDETKAAFEEHGYMLEEASELLAGAPEREGQTILRPREGPAFHVVVTTDSELDDAWPDFERLAGDDSFDARRANVGVFSDSGVVPMGDRKKVLAALEALPDRDAPVLVAGR
jgi:hypothetical protein